MTQGEPLEFQSGIRCACQFPLVSQSESAFEGKALFRVLVVDDDASIRRMIVAALRRGPYQFFEAPNGRDALEIMRAEKPDVVVLDLMMPILSGWDVLRERQGDAALRGIPVILISANRDAAIASAVDQGVCAFLPKPFDIGALTALVQSCVNTSP